MSLAAATSAPPGSRLDPPRPAAPLEERETIEHPTALLEHTERLPAPVRQPRGDDRPPAVEARPVEPGAPPARRRVLRGIFAGALVGTGLAVLLVAVLGEPEWPAPPARLATPDLAPARALSPELGARASDPLPDLAGALLPPELGARPPDQAPERGGDIAVRVKLRQPPPPVAPRTRYGWLTVVTLHGPDDLWAQVWLDGRAIGTSTIYRRRTPAGDHLLEATRDGFKPARRRITLRPDRELKVQLHLTR